MNKRLLSLVLTIAFTFITVFGCFSAISVSASTIVLTDTDYENARAVLGAVCPDYPLTDSEVASDAKPTTRAEFIGAVASVMGVDIKQSAETTFADVDAKHPYSAAIKYAAQAGLINTVDLFYPETPITYSQAIKIVMIAAGYGEKAEYLGGFPVGYIKVANEADVGKNMKLSDNAYLTHDQATKLIFDAAVCDMLEVTSFGSDYTYTVTEGKNILSTYHKVYMAQGVVESNENTSLTSTEPVGGDDYITIDGVNFYAPGKENFIGKSVRVFYGDDKQNTVILAYENGNDVYNYTNEDDLKISGHTLTVMPVDAEKEVRYSLESAYSVIYNGKFYGSANYNSVINPTSGYVTLIDNDDNSKIDVVIIKDVEYGVIKRVNAVEEKIYDKYKQGGTLDLANSSVKYFVSKDDGTAITLDALEEDNAVGYAVSKDGTLIEVICYTGKVGGTFDSLTSDGKVEVNGKEYQLSSYYTQNVKSVGGIKFGSEVILHLGVGNQVIYVQEFTSTVKYGVFVAAGQTSGLSGSDIVLIYGTDGVMHEFNVSDKLKVNGSSVSSSEMTSTLKGIESLEATLRVIKYSVNASGELSKIYTAIDNDKGAAALLTPVVDDARPVLYSRNEATDQGNSSLAGKLMYKSGTFYPLFHMNSSTGVIQVPVSDDYRTSEEYYTAHTQTTLDSATDNIENQPFYGYDVHNGTANFVLWTKDGSGATEVGEGGSAIIESITQGVNENSEPVKVFKAYMNKSWTKIYSKANYNATETSLKETVDKIQPGDIVQIAVNSDKEITAATINFSYLGDDTNGPRYTNPTNKNSLYSAKQVGFETGYVLAMEGKKAVLVRNKEMDDIVAGNYTTINTVAAPISGTVVFVKMNRNRSTGVVTDAVVYNQNDTAAIETYFTSGTNADYLVQRSRYNTVSMTVVYTN